MPSARKVGFSFMTRTGVDRILRYAFELAQTRQRKTVTSATKSNGIAITMPYWDSRFQEMGKNFPDVKTEQFHIDILSDLGPAVTGTIGIAPSGNINPIGEWPSLFEPVHGSALDIAGKGIANPVGAIWAGQMMLLHLGEKEAADAMLKAIDTVLGRAESSVLTPDMKGNGSTKALGEAIARAIETVGVLAVGGA